MIRHMVKIEIYTDKLYYFRWRLVGANGEKVAASEAYTTFGSAKRSAESVKRWANLAIIIE